MAIRSLPLPNHIVIVVTHLGSVYFGMIALLAITVWLVIHKKEKWQIGYWIGVYGAVYLANGLLKAAFRRERPHWTWLVEAHGYSFPSGHAMVSTAFFGLLGYFWVLDCIRKGKRTWPAAIATVALIGCIGFSRVYLGVHYPTDVIAGFAAGAFCLWLSIRCYRLIKYRSSVSKSR